MSATSIELQLLLKLNDQMSRGLRSAMTAAQKDSKGLTNEVNAVARASNNIRTTGINRMTDALNRAKSAAKSTLDILQKTAQAGAALAAGGYVLKTAADKPMAFDRKLALLANTAYSDRDVAGRISGKTQLENAIRQAQKNGLGSQEDLAETLNQLVGSGAMGSGASGLNSSMRLLPILAKAATGTGAESSDLAKIAIAAKQNMGLSDGDTAKFLSKAITAGNEGGFELKDMARYLPAQMALYSANGMKGMAGAEDLLAYNQAARITAGSSDEAGNNLVNLLTKINSHDTAVDFKKQGIDLTGSLALARSKGMSTLDAFMVLVDRVAGKDKSYKALEANAKKQRGPDQQATYQAMLDIIEQKGIGLTVQDRQAMSALLGAKQNKAKLDDVRNKVRADDGGQVAANYGTVRDTSSGAAEALANAKDKAASDSLQSVNGPLSSLLNGTANLAERFPKLAAAAYAAATALGAIAAVAGIKGLLGAGAGAGGASATGAALAGAGGGLLSRLGVTAALAGGMNLSALAGVGAGGLATIAGGVGVAGAAGYGAGTLLNKGINAGLSKITGSDTSLGSLIYDLLHREKEPVTVIVDVKNGNIVASVNASNSRQASRQ